jgi:hypothetical protein
MVQWYEPVGWRANRRESPVAAPDAPPWQARDSPPTPDRGRERTGRWTFPRRLPTGLPDAGRSAYQTRCTTPRGQRVRTGQAMAATYGRPRSGPSRSAWPKKLAPRFDHGGLESELAHIDIGHPRIAALAAQLAASLPNPAGGLAQLSA